MLAPLQNLFIDKFLQHVLDGNKGSNILTAILVPLLGAKIDWVLAWHGLQFQDEAAVIESAKVAGLAVLGVYGWLIGRKKKQ